MTEYRKTEQSDDKKLNKSIERTQMYHEKTSEKLYGN